MRTRTELKSQLDLEYQILNISEKIGNTRLFRIRNLFNKPGVEILAKLEWEQLGGSVKARPAYNIIKKAVAIGELGRDKVLLDATSGNTGIAYASVARELGIPVVLCLPENASQERKDILKELGAELVLTSALEGTDGAQEVAKGLFQQNPDKYFYARQYANEANWQAHYYGTAREMWEQTRGSLTHFVAGLGTTGTFVGTSRRLKEFNPHIQTIALQPDNPMHGLEGWKHLETAHVPAIYDRSTADRFLEVSTERAYELVKQLFIKEGLRVSPSAAANLAGAIQVASGIEKGLIVTTFADNGDKYSEVYNHIGI